MLRVAVLGCGPTGLLAAHAVALSGHEPTIFSNKRKSHLFGSQYLHEPIEGIIDQDEGVEVHYVTNGTPEEYRRKTHGKWWDGIVAPEDFETEHMAWNIREAYDRLWQKYVKQIHHYIFEEVEDGYDQFTTLFNEASYDLRLPRFDLVVSTVPRTLWKMPGEQFIFSEGWALGDAPENGQFVPYECPENTIICDGTKDISYTRLSRVFGHTTVEWPHHATRPPFEGVSKVTKPLRYIPAEVSNPANEMLHVGRYGEWKKGIVVTDAFKDVLKKISEIS